MKLSAVLLLFACAFTPSLASPSSCCLCEHCEDVPEENDAMITVSPFGKAEGTTCGELALDVLDGSDMCVAIQTEYQAGCCTHGTY